MGNLCQRTIQVISIYKEIIERIGNTLIFIGSIAILSFFVMAILSVPAASGGWEYVWFLPRAGFICIIISAAILLAFGLLLRVVPRLIKNKEQ